MGLVLGGRESGRETERDRRERERERERPCCLENSFMEQSRAKWRQYSRWFRVGASEVGVFFMKFMLEVENMF